MDSQSRKDSGGRGGGPRRGSGKGSGGKGSGGSGRSGGSSIASRGHVCAFWVHGQCFGIDTSVVGEVVAVNAITPVPATPDATIGLFNLRGTPMVLIDFAQVVGLSKGGTDQQKSDALTHAIIVRGPSFAAAIKIDAMDNVLEVDVRSALRPATDNDPLVQGVLEGRGKGGAAVTVLRPEVVMEKLEELRFRG